jgi:hypothetical protein
VDLSDLSLPVDSCGFKRFIASCGFPVAFSDLSLPLWILAIYRYLCGFQRFIAALWISAIYRCPVDLSDLLLPVDSSDLSLPCGFPSGSIASVCLSVQRGEQRSVLSVKLRVQRGEQRSVPLSEYMQGAPL